MWRRKREPEKEASKANEVNASIIRTSKWYMNKKIKIKAFGEINDNCIGVCTIAYHDRHSKPTTTALILTIWFGSIQLGERETSTESCWVAERGKGERGGGIAMAAGRSEVWVEWSCVNIDGDKMRKSHLTQIPFVSTSSAALSACSDVFVNAFLLFIFKQIAHAELTCLYSPNYFPSSTWDLLHAFEAYWAKCRQTQNPECKMLHSNLITLDLFMHLMLLHNNNNSHNGSYKIAFEERIAIDRFLLLYVSKICFCLCSWSANFTNPHSVHLPSLCANALHCVAFLFHFQFSCYSHPQWIFCWWTMKWIFVLSLNDG